MGIVDESPASQLSHPSDPKKFACVLVREGSNLQWYTFDIDDDDKHNQSLHHDTNCGAEKILMPKAWSSDRGVGWAIMGQTLYHVRRESMLEILKARPVQIPGNRLEWFDITTGKTPMAMETEWIKASPRMPNHVVRVHTMVLDGKIYCLGGYPSPTPEKKIKAKQEEEQPPRPWAMAYDPSLDKWESLPDPPYRPAAMNLNVFSAAVAALGLLVVGCPSKGLLQLYRTDTMVWELDDKFDMRSRPFPRDLLWGPTLAVNTMLYWYGIKSARLGAYDLVTKTWFVASLPIHDHHDYWDSSAAHYPRCLFHVIILGPHRRHFLPTSHSDHRLPKGNVLHDRRFGMVIWEYRILGMVIWKATLATPDNCWRYVILYCSFVYYYVLAFYFGHPFVYYKVTIALPFWGGEAWLYTICAMALAANAILDLFFVMSVVQCTKKNNSYGSICIMDFEHDK